MVDLVKRPAVREALGLGSREGRTPGSTAQVQMATEVVTALAQGLRSYQETTDAVDTNRPRGSLTSYAKDYAAARAELDAAVAAGETGKMSELILAATAAADELAIRTALNPSSRIRPAYDRRAQPGQTPVRAADVTPPGSTVKVVQVADAQFRDDASWAELTEGGKFTLAQRMFDAKMDFHLWRLQQGLIAVDEVDVRVDLTLTARCVPDRLGTQGKDIVLPPGVDSVHYMHQRDESPWRGPHAYAHRSYATKEDTHRA